jgi:hypothetical protein
VGAASLTAKALLPPSVGNYGLLFVEFLHFIVNVLLHFVIIAYKGI